MKKEIPFRDLGQDEMWIAMEVYKRADFVFEQYLKSTPTKWAEMKRERDVSIVNDAVELLKADARIDQIPQKKSDMTEAFWVDSTWDVYMRYATKRFERGRVKSAFDVVMFRLCGVWCACI